MKLHEGGVYLVNGTELIPEGPEAAAQISAKTGAAVSKEEAAKNTIAYGILKDHNTSGNMDKLKIKFDKLTSHEITFVGIIQTDVYKRQDQTCKHCNHCGKRRKCGAFKPDPP